MLPRNGSNHPANRRDATQFGHPEFARTYDLAIDTTAMSPMDGAKAIWEFLLAQKNDKLEGQHN
jgi:chloramphenicol 3-O-phosphotransferase